LACVLIGITLGAGKAVAAAVEEGAVLKEAITASRAGKNLAAANAASAYERGFRSQDGLIVCDNGTDAQAKRGAAFHVTLNQRRPEPLVASARSKAEKVGGSPDNDYSVYVDLVYADDTSLWGQAAPFHAGTHDWERREVVILPDKPVKGLSFYMLFRGHSGKAWFRDPELKVLRAPQGSRRFDGVPVIQRAGPLAGFQVRDAAAGSDFVRIERQALGLSLAISETREEGLRIFDATLSDTTGKDRAVTLVYALPVRPRGLRWFQDPRSAMPLDAEQEAMFAGPVRAGASGRLSRYPLGAVQSGSRGLAVGIDMAFPAVFRIGCNAGTGELFLAYDLGLTLEKPEAHVRFCCYRFDPAWGFRAALARYYALFPEAFRCRTPEQGLWMPFARISLVKGWEDFGFKFKEGNDETKWDDEHGILTFRYTEPMTWWMTMPRSMPRTVQAAVAEAGRLARQKNDPQAKALLSSGYYDETGQLVARLLDTPWCNGAVWSMNSMPGVRGTVTDFRTKWNPRIREEFYGPKRPGDLDGEYIDSSEGYVTDELDFRRDHFAGAETPLSFSPDSRQPAIYRGLVALEYVRGIARDVHAMGKLMMANGTPTQLCWLAPQLEVMGTETDWNPEGRWGPMSDAELLYRRVLCKGKPYCFLMNTRFERFPAELVEKYMKRSLAYGMFPGFFSHNAAEGHYFSRPELYNRDRPLFKKYVPLVKRVAEAGWEPITQARSDRKDVYVERFGSGRTTYLTVLNDGRGRQSATIRLEGPSPRSSRELLSGRPISWTDGAATLALEAEDVAVIENQW
jgi:hypothetical protein